VSENTATHGIRSDQQTAMMSEMRNEVVRATATSFIATHRHLFFIFALIARVEIGTQWISWKNVRASEDYSNV
jgi:hypothetical protein